MIALLVVVAVLAFALVGAGVGWSRGWFATAPQLKPAAGQTFPDTFGDRNVRVVTGAEKRTSALYKDSSGRTFTIGLVETNQILTEVAAREQPQFTKTYGGDVHCFNVAKNPRLCHLQLRGGWLSFSSSQEWDGDRIAGIVHDFYAQMKS